MSATSAHPRPLTYDEWLSRLPALVRESADRWRLTPGKPYSAGAGGHALRVTLPGGAPAVLKLIFPHREAEHEAAALDRWAGDGAVRLLAHDPGRQAVLLERCEPGAPLSATDPERALDVLIGLLPRLWTSAAEPFRTLAEEAAWWVDYLPSEWDRAGRPFERRLLDGAIDALTSLSTSQGEQVLLHQDLHGANVLTAQREPWLTIDPKPLVGERDFAVAPIVRSGELGGERKDVLRRLDRLTSELGLDRERARGWTIGQTIAWSCDGDAAEQHEVARWLLDAA